MSDSHERYLQACTVEAVIICGGDTNVEGVRFIIEHLDGGPKCDACETDLMRGRPDDIGEANFLARYLDHLVSGKPTRDQLQAVRCLGLKYGGRTPAELVSRYREAKAAEQARRKAEEAA